MKKIFTLLVAAMCAMSMWAHDFEVNGIYYKILTNKTNEVAVTYRGESYSSYDEYSGSVVIPMIVTNGGIEYSVTSIGNYAFYKCSGLTSIEIPNSVTSIGSSAFYLCYSLTAITIPSSVEYAEGDVFSGCYFTKGNFINNAGMDIYGSYNWGERIGEKEIDGMLITKDTLIACRPSVITRNYT